MSGVAVLRFVFAIVFDALAFTVWDVGTRPPLRLLRDVARGVRVPGVLARGVVRGLVGAGLLLLAALVARPAISRVGTFMLLETGMLFVALLVELLVGNDLRATLHARPKPPQTSR